LILTAEEQWLLMLCHIQPVATQQSLTAQ